MIPFTPSAAFVTFFNQVIAAAEAPVVPGGFSMDIPPFADPQENTFAQTVLAGLIQEIAAMRASVTPQTLTPTQLYAVDPMGQPYYPEMWGTGAGAP